MREYKKYSIGNVKIQGHEAYKDIMLFLDGRKERALQSLKKADDPVARATWRLVDEFYERLESLKQEVLLKQKQEEQ